MPLARPPPPPEGPPPTPHVLKAHHVALLTVIMLLYKEFMQPHRSMPPLFLLHIYRTLLSQVAEVSHPMPLRILLVTLNTGKQGNHDTSQEFLSALSTLHEDLATVDRLTDFFGNLPTMFVEKEDEGASNFPPLHRRSILGFFCRRSWVSFVKLSFQGVVKLHADYLSWCAGNVIPKPLVKPLKGPLSNSDNILLKTEMDKQQWATADSFETHELAAVVGDGAVAVENLRRFFEQRFHAGTDSGYRQMSLLNLGRLHYKRGEYGAARKFLQEGVTVSRTMADRLTLQHCTSLLRRLPSSNPDDRPLLNEIAAELNPLDILYDVNKLLKPEHEQPLSSAFEKLVQGMGLYDNWIDVQMASGSDQEQWAQHCVQSAIWKEAGCDRLATVEENIVHAFSEFSGEDQTRLTAILNRSYKRARDGDYNSALADLLEPSVWKGISMDDHSRWANEIWNVLMLRAIRRGELRLCREYLIPRRPAGSFDPKSYFLDVPATADTMKSLIRDQLHRVIQLKHLDQISMAVKEILEALWHSEFQGRFNLYRIAMILLADVGMEFGLTRWSLKMMEEILPQIVGSDERELRAFGCFTYARCLLCSATAQDDPRQQVVRFLQMAESDYDKLEITDSLIQVQYILTAVLNSQDRTRDKDLTTRRMLENEDKRVKAESTVNFEPCRKVLEVVTLVGAGLVSRV